MRIAIALLALSGCATTPAPATGTCDARPARHLVGQGIDRLDEARHAAGATTVRTVGPDMIVTTEYRRGRLTVDIAADGRIAALRCG